MRENRYNRKGLGRGNFFTIKFVREISTTYLIISSYDVTYRHNLDISCNSDNKKMFILNFDISNLFHFYLYIINVKCNRSVDVFIFYDIVLESFFLFYCINLC